MKNTERTGSCMKTGCEATRVKICAPPLDLQQVGGINAAFEELGTTRLVAILLKVNRHAWSRISSRVVCLHYKLAQGLSDRRANEASRLMGLGLLGLRHVPPA